MNRKSNRERVSFSTDYRLIKLFDKMLIEKGYPGRVEVLEKLIKDFISQDEAVTNEKMIGILAISYKETAKVFLNHLKGLKETYKSYIINEVITPIGDINRVIVFTMLGKANQLTKISNKMISQRGINTYSFELLTIGKQFKN